MSHKSLSSVDTAWLRMEHPTNLMMITAVMVFSTPIDFERLKATIECRMLAPFPRFRQRAVETALPIGAPHWEDDPSFDIQAHMHRISLPPPGDQAALQDIASDLASTQLDFSRPLWEIHVVEKYGSGSALVVRLHHCIADGIALMHVLLSLTDQQADAAWPSPPTKSKRRRGGVLAPLRSAAQITSQVTGALLHEGMETLVNPAHIVDLARVGTTGVKDFGRLVLRWPDPKTIFKGKLGVLKRAAWSAPIALQDVKTIGRSLGGTVNDVLLTVMTGALRRYLVRRNQPVDDVNFRAIVPVNLRPLDRPPELGNKFGLVFLSLPIYEGDPLKRLLELKRRMDGLKDTYEPIVAFGILNSIGLAPTEIHNIVVNVFGTKGTAVMTNVPGPRQQLYLAGAPIDSIMFWVPQSGRLGMGVSIMSYNDKVWMGLITDKGLVPDPETIIDAFNAEFKQLFKLAQSKKKPSPAVKPMVTMLDDAIQALDEVRRASPKAGQARCQAVTRSGKPCKNRALPGSKRCRVHKKK